MDSKKQEDGALRALKQKRESDDVSNRFESSNWEDSWVSSKNTEIWHSCKDLVICNISTYSEDLFVNEKEKGRVLLYEGKKQKGSISADVCHVCYSSTATLVL